MKKFRQVCTWLNSVAVSLLLSLVEGMIQFDHVFQLPGGWGRCPQAGASGALEGYDLGSSVPAGSTTWTVSYLNTYQRVNTCKYNAKTPRLSRLLDEAGNHVSFWSFWVHNSMKDLLVSFERRTDCWDEKISKGTAIRDKLAKLRIELTWSTPGCFKYQTWKIPRSHQKPFFFKDTLQAAGNF